MARTRMGRLVVRLFAPGQRPEHGASDFKTDTGSVSFTVTVVNDRPVAVDEILSSVGEESGTRTIAFAALTDNDGDGDPEEVQTLLVSAVFNPVGGTVSLDGLGNVLFTPAANFNGIASFDYRVMDNGQTNGSNDFQSSDTGRASFTITAVNDAPIVTAGGTLAYPENQVATAIRPTLTLMDVDATNLAGATATTPIFRWGRW